MNRRMVFSTVGKILELEAALFLLPISVSLIYHEYSVLLTFIYSAIGSLILGFLISKISNPSNTVIYPKEGFLIVALSWVMMSAVGAVPFVLSGEIPNYIDAFFETVSGFTTTGASVVNDVEAMSHGVLFWRSFTHWIGGMGVLVFIMAIASNITDRSIHIMRAEMPGPIVGKLVPKAKDTAKILYIIYVVMTMVEIILLCAGGMPCFDSIVHSFGTAGTGGFGIKADSIGGYSAYCQWVITIFMVLFGVNFNLYYLILVRKFKSVLKSTELWVYLGIICGSIVVISINVFAQFGGLPIGEVIRHSSFQVASIVTTTGFATTDFNQWPVVSKTLLLVLMLIGSCAGSTAGGLKVSRFVILCKSAKREIKHLIHPNSINFVRYEGKVLDTPTLHGVNTYFILYILCLFGTFILISFDKTGFDIEANFSAAASCFNNIGPGLSFVGPTSNYSQYSAVSKIVLSVAMLLGRLEIYPLLIALVPSNWKKR